MQDDPFVVAGERLASRLLVGTGKFAAHAVDAGRRAGQRHRGGHGRAAPGRPGPGRRGRHPRLRPGRACGCCPTRPARWTRTRRSGWPGSAGPAPARRLGQARGDPRPAHARARPGGDAARGRAAGRRRLHGAALLLGRPGAVQAPGGGRLRDGDAARVVDRLEPGAAHPGRARDHRRAGRSCRWSSTPGIGAPSRRRRGDGDRRRRGAGQHRHRGAAGPGRAWRGVRAGGRGGPAGYLAGRAAVARRRAEASSPLTGFLGR